MNTTPRATSEPEIPQFSSSKLVISYNILPNKELQGEKRLAKHLPLHLTWFITHLKIYEKKNSNLVLWCHGPGFLFHPAVCDSDIICMAWAVPYSSRLWLSAQNGWWNESGSMLEKYFWSEQSHGKLIISWTKLTPHHPLEKVVIGSRMSTGN